MSQAPLFSVIIPSYGRPRFLREAVDSVLAQTVEDFECIVVDDATPEPLEVPQDPRVHLVRRETNGGHAAARNTGLQRARGRYVTFLDDDDLYSPDRLAMALDGVNQAPIAVCWSRYVSQSSEAGRILNGDVRGRIHEDMVPHLGTTTLVREKVPRFDQTFRSVVDVEWWVRAATKHPVATVPQTGYLVRQHSGKRHLNDKAARVRDSIRLLDLHADYFRDYPRARAFRLKRVGIMARQLGDYGLARTALWWALRLHAEPRVVWHLVRSAQPTAAPLVEARQLLKSDRLRVTGTATHRVRTRERPERPPT